jgi:hypothetical protein
MMDIKIMKFRAASYAISNLKAGIGSAISRGVFNPIRNKFCIVGIYSIAMAWVEAAVVFDLRVMINRLVPFQPDPLPNFGSLGLAEGIREAATLIMLIAIGLLAGETWKTRLGFSAVAFGIWDIAYYLFLIPLTGWPRSLLDWDILFLLPLPWWGPVIAPISISCLLIFSGGCIVYFQRKGTITRFSPISLWIGAAGTILVLLSFLMNSLRLIGFGMETIRHSLPMDFPWIVFLLGYVCLAYPVARMLRLSTCFVFRQQK